MTVQIKDADGQTRTVKTADDIIDALTAQATATSVKGSPTAQMLTVQDGNRVLQLAPVSRTDTATPFFTLDLGTDGAAADTLCFQIVALGGGASLVAQLSNDGATWYAARIGSAVSEIMAGSVSALGLHYVETKARYVRLIQTAITSGTTTVLGFLSKGPPSLRQVVATGALGTGAALSGLMARNALRASNVNPAANGNATAVDLLATLIGVQVVKPFSLPEADWSYAAAAGGIVNSSDVPLVAAAGAGIRNYLTSIDVANTHASVDTEVVVKDGSTVIWRRKFKAGDRSSFHFNSPLKSSANAALNVSCITTGSEVYVNAQGYIAP